MCDLALYRENNNGSTMLSNIFIDDYLAEANDAQIKVYLYLIRMTASGRPTTISDIADKFNHTEKDVCRALRFWEKKRLISLNYDDQGAIVGIRLFEPTSINRQPVNIQTSFTPVMSVSPQEGATVTDFNTIPKQTASKVTEPTTLKKPNYSANELKNFQSRPEATSLVFIAESYLKRQLSAHDIHSLMFYVDELRFSENLIDYLLQFCVSRKKDKVSFAYIDKVAIDWAENNIATMDEAKKYCASFDKSFSSGASSNKVSGRESNKKTTLFHQFEQRDYDFDKLEAQLLKR